MKIFISLILSILALHGFSQEVIDTTFSVSSGQFYTFNASEYSGLVIKNPSTGQYILLGNDSIPVIEDPHSETSTTISLRKEQIEIKFYSGEYSGQMTFYFISIKKLPANLRTRSTSSDTCNPEIVPPSVWRNGLNPPSYTPSKSNTSHIIVHHAATSNSDTDPYQTVRNIYVHHTQVNGWSDIGYNYLIGRDGTIFQGRDSKGLFDPDYTIGAHMCGKNAYTMGICMLGNYVSEAPTEAALNSLSKLIAWKSNKDNIEIMGSSLHAIGPGSAGIPDRQLNHVAGHREGCQSGYTVCPGDALFGLLPEVRDVSEEFKNDLCSDSIPTSNEEPEPVLFPNPTSESFEANFEWDTVYVYDLTGKMILTQSSEYETKIALPPLKPGMYICAFLLSEDRYRYLRLLVKK